MTDIAVLAFPHTYMASLGAITDPYARIGEMHEANRALHDYAEIQTRLRLLTPDGEALTLAGGRQLRSDGGPGGVSDVKLVYIPAHRAPSEAPRAPPPAGVASWLQGLAERGVLICASGAGVWTLAACGLLVGRQAAVDARSAPAFAQAFPKVRLETQRPMTTTGSIWTCAAEAREPDFVIRALEQTMTPGVALWLSLRRNAAAGEDGDVARDPLVARAQMMIRERFTEDLRIEAVAKALSVSHKTLIRHFRKVTGSTPRAYAQFQRLESALSMLRETDRKVAEIAALVGYSDAPSFRAAFLARFAMTPTAYRDSMAGPTKAPGRR